MMIGLGIFAGLFFSMGVALLLGAMIGGRKP